MRTVRLILREACHRYATSLLTVLAVGVAAALVVFFITAARASSDETRIIQRDIGLNVVILPAETDMDRYWALGAPDTTMPQQYIEAVTNQAVANRLIPMLRRRVTWQGMDVMLTGLAPEVFPRGKREKPALGVDVAPGSLVVGSEVAGTLGLERGQAVELMGESFTIARTLGATGSDEDVRVYGSLADVQRLLGLPGRISEIQALECFCSSPGQDPLAMLRAELEPLLPGTKILRRTRTAEARQKQRWMADRYLAILSPVVLVLCGAWVATLAAINVRERRAEIGLLRALGFGSPSVALLFLGRSIAVGALGGALGFVLGARLALWLGPAVFPAAARNMHADSGLLLWSLLLAPLFAAAASLIPTALAVTQDPAVALREE